MTRAFDSVAINPTGSQRFLGVRADVVNGMDRPVHVHQADRRSGQVGAERVTRRDIRNRADVNHRTFFAIAA